MRVKVSMNPGRPLVDVLKSLIEKHFRYTGSFRAKEILHDWTNKRIRFVKVFPNEYRRALQQMNAAKAKAEPQKLAA